MSNPPTKQTRPTRRALLGGLSIGVAAVAVDAVTSPANATQGQPVIAGELNTSTSPTSLRNDDGPALLVNSATSGALYADSGLDVAIQATAHKSDALFATTVAPDSQASALRAMNSGAGDAVNGTSFSKNGVYGLSKSSTATGVYGDNDLAGYGVVGRSTGTGVGVWANSPDGTALRTTGKLELQDRSGLATIASGKKSVTVTLAGVTANSMVMATVQKAGGFFASVVPGAGSFTIYLNKAPVSPATAKVAYLVLN